MADEPPAERRCELGRYEYGGGRYCYNHGGFAHMGGDSWCDKSPMWLERKDPAHKCLGDRPRPATRNGAR